MTLTENIIEVKGCFYSGTEVKKFLREQAKELEEYYLVETTKEVRENCEAQIKNIKNIIKIKTKDKGMNCEYEKENKEVIKYIMKELLKEFENNTVNAVKRNEVKNEK